MLHKLQEIVDRVSADVGVPASLTDTLLNSVVFGPHDNAAIDAVRREALLLRSTPGWVREWFNRYGITHRARWNARRAAARIRCGHRRRARSDAGRIDAVDRLRRVAVSHTLGCKAPSAYRSVPARRSG